MQRQNRCDWAKEQDLRPNRHLTLYMLRLLKRAHRDTKFGIKVYLNTYLKKYKESSQDRALKTNHTAKL